MKFHVNKYCFHIASYITSCKIYKTKYANMQYNFKYKHMDLLAHGYVCVYKYIFASCTSYHVPKCMSCHKGIVAIIYMYHIPDCHAIYYLISKP